MAANHSVLALALVTVGTLAFSQTPASISVVSGNGQLVCGLCANAPTGVFEPLIVAVADSQGSPVSGVTVDWIVASSDTTASVNAATTITAADGTASNTLNVYSPSNRTVYSVVALVANSNVGVTFTLTAVGPNFPSYAQAQVTSGLYGTISGQAGGAGSPPIQVEVRDLAGIPIPNVSVRLTPALGYIPGPSAACATGSGADPGSVLTDQFGTATCTPVFGPIPGRGNYQVLVGGVANTPFNGGPVGFTEFPGEFIQVAPVAPGAMKIISGNQQSANPGKALVAPLVAEVDTTAGYPVADTSVTWSVSPSGAAYVSSSTSTSDANGQASTSVTLAPSAVGNVQITATAGVASVTFTVTANPAVTGLTKVSGDSQSAVAGTSFGQALVVQATAANGQVAANVPVQFSISGSGTLSSSTATTDTTGRASVTVTAGSTAGPVTVAATVGTYSVSFGLTVTPPITSGNFLNGAGFFATDSVHAALVPCGIGTVIANGIAPNIQGVVAAPSTGPLPYQLANVGISFNGSQAPLYNVANVNGQQQAAFQVPCDVTPSNAAPVTVTVGGNSTNVNVAVRSAGPGLFEYADSDGLLNAVVVRPNGSYVSSANPAQAGETLRVYATGIGQVQPAVPTNSVPPAGTDSVALGTVIVSLNNTRLPLISARRAPGLIGVDEITFQLPASAPSGRLGVLYVAVFPADNPTTYQISNTAWLPVQ